MAHQTKVAQWLFNHSQIFHPKLRELTWPSMLGFSLFDFEVEIHFHGRKYIGRGSDEKEEIALAKACSEVIERAVCGYFKISSEGAAAHFDSNSAAELSKNEALERALLWWHRKNHVPFGKLDTSGVTPLLPENKNKYDSADFASFGAPDGLTGILCILGRDERKFLGVCLGSNSDQSLHRALIEALRNLMAFSLDPQSFSLQTERDPDFWCCNPKIVNEFRHLIHPAVLSSALPALEIETRLLPIRQINEFERCPIFVAHSRVEVRA